jgi:hypothetical protein
MMHHSQTEPCITDVDTANKARLECAVPNIGDGECAAVPSRSRAEHARSAANIYDFTDDFDMRRVCSYFERALCNRTVAESDGAALSDIDLQSFVLAYRELNKFVLVFFFMGVANALRLVYCRMFPLFGFLFKFVQMDVDEKEKTLQQYLDSVCGTAVGMLHHISAAVDYLLDCVRHVRE